jgi:hypothetical protein
VDTVTSNDGTTIAFDRSGDGPPVVLVCGGSVDRMSNASLAQHLAADFTVLNYDRRGRGDSGDTEPYAVEREIEDLDAVIAAAGGASPVYGSSSGAVLALDAAAAGSSITQLALWEPPFILPGTRPMPPADTASIYRDFVAQGRRGDAAEFFMAKVVGMPPEFVAQARQAPWWPAQEALAHTLAYDAEIMGDYSIPIERLRSVTTPTLVLDGGSLDWMNASIQALADALPNGARRTLQGQTHDVDPTVLAPAVRGFLAS